MGVDVFRPDGSVDVQGVMHFGFCVLGQAPRDNGGDENPEDDPYDIPDLGFVREAFGLVHLAAP